jgi:hypothetical protein
MPYYRVKFDYVCHNGHHNHDEKYYEDKSVETIETRFPSMLVCSSCPPGTVSISDVRTEFDAEEISRAEFIASGADLEPSD